MVQLTRQDCAIASAGLMRSGLAHALNHARHRSVFQKHLADQPLMQAVLSDMALHVEASIALVMSLFFITVNELWFRRRCGGWRGE